MRSVCAVPENDVGALAGGNRESGAAGENMSRKQFDALSGKLYRRLWVSCGDKEEKSVLASSLWV